MVGNYEIKGQNDCVVLMAGETLNLPAVPANLDVEKTYKQTSELFFTLPEGSSLADFNSYDLLYVEPVKEVDRFVYAKDPSGNEVVLKHALNPNERFKASVERYELMVLYPGYIEIFNSNNTRIFASELNTPDNDYENGGDLGEGDGDLGGGGSTNPGGGSPGDSIQIIPIQGDSIFEIIGPDFITRVNKPNGFILETVFDEFGVWIEKELTLYNPYEPERTRPVFELLISRDTLPISGDCIFKVVSNFYEDYCSVEIQDSSHLRIVNFEEKISSVSIKHWPNPASNYLSIEIESSTTNSTIMAEIEIINLEGKIVFSDSSPINQSRTIDVSQLPSGLYIITAKAANEYTAERVLIQR